MSTLKHYFIISLYCLFGGSILSATAQTENLGLFDNENPLKMTLSGTLPPFSEDPSKTPRKYLQVLSYQNANGNKMEIPIEVKTRGHFRRLLGHCSYPPLQLIFPKNEVQQTSIFKDQSKTKLVMPCRGDEYVIREWLVYKLYNLISPYSFRVRLVQLTLEDEQRKKPIEPFYAFLLEEEKQIAKRLQMLPLERKLRANATQAEHFLRMAVFEYLIANTDWSVEHLQNIKLLTPDAKTLPIPVPYDFDHAGLVDAPYAKPAMELELGSVRDRRYRGYCLENVQQFEPVIAHFNALKDKIYQIFSDCNLLNPKYQKSTMLFLDEFYATINNPKKWQKEFLYPCDPNGTGYVVIKGLRED
ncbi:MAG: hypothetical protein SFV55_25565 [Haliscomenobacter sp.]|uniref:hypothetical protein n=1 Tax=Haliscomenobacter sp. TaxID=2717303 RepID=UPI0029B7ABCD|nr:hypothetical protein [Haliscomenobacter sp.]MDX2071827.1 hypothetical protein [Haliscomenobacter sp.]